MQRERTNYSKLMISHNDLDGHGAILLGMLLGNKKPELIYDKIISENYGFEEKEDLWKEILKYDTVHMVDISVPKEKYEELVKNCNITLFDHHDSSEVLSSFPDTYHDQTRCGTKIYFEEYFLKELKRVPRVYYDFVERVNIYDTWQEESELWEEGCNLNRVLMGLTNWGDKDSLSATSAFYAKYQVKLNRLNNWKWLDSEKALIERAIAKEEKSYQEAMSKLSIRKDYKGDIFGVSSIGSKISLVCARILKENPMLRYIIIVNSFNKKDGRISIRSRDPDFDCTKVFPFEGHFSAAGGERDENELNEFLENDSLCFIRKEDITTDEMFEICLKV